MRAYDAAFYVAVFFVLGIAGASLEVSIWLVLLFAAILILFLYKKLTTVWLSWFGVFFLLVFAGYFYFNWHAVLYKEEIILNKEIIFTGTIIREPRSGLQAQELTMKLAAPYKGEVLVYTSTYPQYAYGDILKVSGKVSKSTSGRSNIVSFPRIELVEKSRGNALRSFLFSVKRTLVESLARVLPQEKSAFIAGILFGEKSEFSEGFKEALKKSGTTHLVALSGYNVSIIAITLSNVLSYFWNRRRVFWLSTAFIILFVLMTGAEESVVRAAFMGVIFLISERSSRLYSFRNAVTLTAFVMLLLNPKLLIFNVGFQLSFMALIGLIYLKPVLEKLFHIVKKETFLNWRENLLQTFSAQIAVLPVVLSAFGYFSPLSLFPNVLILEFMPLTMFLGFMTAFVGVVSYHLSFLVALPLSVLLGYEIFIINFFGSYLS